MSNLALVVLAGMMVQVAYAEEDAATLPAFEVASIKPDSVPPGVGRFVRVECPNGRFSSRDASVWYLIKWAWNVVSDNDRVAGHPDWTGRTNYEIDAKSATPVSEDQCRLMLRSLLIDRFQLRAHEERRTLDALDLVIAKGGPKIERVTDPDAPANGPGLTISGESISGWIEKPEAGRCSSLLTAS
jgi:uncharacterized protein (TIGR03435 family)